jgi:hypothetical protein
MGTTEHNMQESEKTAEVVARPKEKGNANFWVHERNSGPQRTHR